MGADKAEQRYHGRPQGLWSYEALQRVCESVWLSARQEQDFAWIGERPLIRDGYHNLGPAAGLLSAADAAPDCAWLLLACDMPLIDQETLQVLAAARARKAPAVAFRHPNGTPEPLCAVYEPVVCQALRSRIQDGLGSSLRALLEAADTTWLTPPDPARLANANDPAARAALRRQIETGPE